MLRALLARPRIAVANVEDNPADFDRLLSWISQEASNEPLGWPVARLRSRLLEFYLRSGGAARSHIRKWIATALSRPANLAFDDAMALAAVLPTPEARPALLAYLADYAVPPAGAAPRDLDPCLAARLASAIDSLAHVAELRDREVFAYLVARYCRSPMDDDAHWRVARRAAVAYARVAPVDAGQMLPIFFGRDPQVAVHLRGMIRH